MFKKTFIVCLMLLGFSATPWAQGTAMTDQQVTEYVEMGLQQGKSQQQIATELARRGVTREQAERVRKLYEQSNKNKGNASAQAVDRNRGKQKLASDQEYVGRDFNFESGKATGTPQSKVYKYITTQEFKM